MNLTIDKKPSQKEFEDFWPKNKDFRGGKFLQSFQWALFLKKREERAVYWLIKDGERAVGKLMLVLRKVLPRIDYAYSPFGPVLEWESLNKEEVGEIFELIGKELEQEGATFWRFNPPLQVTEGFAVKNLHLSQAKTKEPEETLYLELDKSEKELLGEMKSKTRYNIRLAERKNLKIEAGFSPELLENFLKLSRETSERNRFGLHETAYYKTMVEELGRAGILKIYAAFLGKTAIAANLCLFFEDTVTYLHGASSNEHRNLMAPYLLQWQAIKKAQKEGFSFYDFWGVDEKKWPGVTRFKLGFGGKRVHFEPTWEKPLKRGRYALYRLLKKVQP